MAPLRSTSIVSIFYLNILILCIQGNPAFSNLPLHGKKNSTLLKQILNVGSGDKVPEYEIVQLRILSKRSVDDQDVLRVNLHAFGKHLRLRLQRNDDFERSKHAKVYKAELTDTGDVQLTEVICEEDHETPYVDPVLMAAVTISHGPDGKLQMEGVIGEDLLIIPAPADVEILSDYFSDDNGGLATAKSGVHIVYRSLMKSTISYKVALDDVFATLDSTGEGRRRKRSLQAWPEVLLLVDHDSYALHLSRGFTDAQIRRYYLSFMNGVDLRFKIISDPKISLVLSRIIIFKSQDYTPYLKYNLDSYENAFEGQKAIHELTYQVYSVKMQKRDTYPDFDVAILLTNLDMCTDEVVGCNKGTVGLAYFMGACNKHRDDSRWMGVAIVEDNGGFDGILTAAHEIGHLLGSAHDGDIHPHLSRRDTSICNHEDGYIMSHKLTSNRIFQWSECSIKQFKHFLNLERSSCLFNQPGYRNKLEGSELPGAVMSLDEQCERVWGTKANAWDSRVCTSLHCHKPSNMSLTKASAANLSPAADGSPCGQDKHCMHGKCVSKSLTYSPAWNMAPDRDSWEYKDYPPTTSTTEKPPLVDNACAEDKEDFFCDSYFSTVVRLEACKNSRVLEECCYSHKIFCRV